MELYWVVVRCAKSQSIELAELIASESVAIDLKRVSRPDMTIGQLSSCFVTFFRSITLLDVAAYFELTYHEERAARNALDRIRVRSQ